MATDQNNVSDEEESQAIRRHSSSSLLLVILLFRILNSLHWAFVGGLGWGVGAVLGKIQSVQASTYGGAIGFVVMMSFLLLLSDGHRKTHIVWVMMSGAGGAAFGAIGGAAYWGADFGALVGGLLGLMLGGLASIMRQDHFNVNPLVAVLTAILGAVWLIAIPLLVPGIVGWMIAGGISLFSMRLFAELFRREAIVEVDDNGEPLREVPTSECCLHVIRESWWPTSLLAWGWHGAFAGLLVVLSANSTLRIEDHKLVRFVLVFTAIVGFVGATWQRFKKQPLSKEDENT